MAEAGAMSVAAPSHTLRSSGWWLLLAVGAVGILVSRLLPDGLPRSIAFAVYGPIAAASIVVGVRMHRPTRVLPWYLMAAAHVIWGVADLVGAIYGDLLGEEQFPAPSDAIYLVGYPVMGLGLLLLSRERWRRGLASLLDSAILMMALGLLTWVALAQPTLSALGVSAVAAAISLAYPIADVVLAAILVPLVGAPWGRTPAFWLLVSGAGTLLLADLLASALEQLTWASSDHLEVIWMASYLFWAAAALHPSMAGAPEASREAERGFSRTGLIALALALVMPGALLAGKELIGQDVDVWPLVAGWVVICALVIARIGVAMTAMEQARAERERALIALAHQATHDALTGLANRAQALELIRSALSRARRSGDVVGLLYIDLDGFKQVNDTLGHAAGDQVLEVAGRRMQEGVRGGDVVARLGGDEFVVLLEPVADEVSAVGVAERLVADLAEPIQLSSGREARIGASIGVTINSDLTIDPERLLQEADHAVFRAKATGRGRVEVFAPSQRAEIERRAAVQTAIVGALRDDTASVQTSPIIDLRTDRLAGEELEVVVPDPAGALWQRRQLLPLSRGTDNMCDLDGWVLRRGVLTRPGDGWLVVPVTGRHLSQGTIVAEVNAALEAGLVANRLMLLVPSDEVGGARVLDTLRQLRTLGVRICADSFGGDDSGTDRWTRAPFDFVQLDPRLLDTRGGDLLLRLTVETANAFGYRVIAPGIVTESEAEVVAAAGCELGLGPLYSDAAGAALSQPSSSSTGNGRDHR
ncbi:diguanylate cyclase [Micropruina sp.]|uniref:diguanylate cyclase n=1 Tax=Micropruina sp. TaxID=2737536 RepID=UPI0039E65B12